MFALSRKSDWFETYNKGLTPSWMSSLVKPLVLAACPAANHPHELFRSLNGEIKRNHFKDSFNRTSCMNNIMQNVYHPLHWVDRGPRPAGRGHRHGLAIHHSASPAETENTPKCVACNDWTGPLSNCRCVPDQLYESHLVEIQTIQGRSYITPWSSSTVANCRGPTDRRVCGRTHTF